MIVFKTKIISCHGMSLWKDAISLSWDRLQGRGRGNTIEEFTKNEKSTIKNEIWIPM